jgi:hypothetical protein
MATVRTLEDLTKFSKGRKCKFTNPILEAFTVTSTEFGEQSPCG